MTGKDDDFGEKDALGHLDQRVDLQVGHTFDGQEES